MEEIIETIITLTAYFILSYAVIYDSNAKLFNKTFWIKVILLNLGLIMLKIIEICKQNKH